MPDQPILVGGAWTATSTPLDVRNPFDETLVARTWAGGGEEFERAASAAVEAAPAIAALPAFERAAILRRVSAALLAGRDGLARTLAQEAGKPLRDAVTEVERAATTFSVAADESLRIFGEVLPLDLAPHGAGRFAITRRFPIGPVAAITPFNFPMNLAAHKLAPAIAAGNSIVLKPATKTPLSALALGRLVDEAGAPKGAVSVIPLTREASDRVVTDDRFHLLTFTGSAVVGWAMKARAGRKRVILELGGNAGVIVDADANLDLAVRRIVAGGFGYAGQSCISVQRIYVHTQVFDEVARALVAAVERLTVGDPLDPASDLGPLITADDAARVDAWVHEAMDAGARVLTGGRRVGRAAYAPTVMTDVPPAARVCADEVFAPLVGLYRFEDFGGAIDAVNQSRYGLQAGVFTNTLRHALEAFRRLEVGGVVMNDVPSWRIDHMPYGGVKDSGLGREGPRYTIEEMTELRLLVINQDF
jgi:acyl-CoA reductase-like NAD-dependent aldehyde dehydrogenase